MPLCLFLFTSMWCLGFLGKNFDADVFFLLPDNMCLKTYFLKSKVYRSKDIISQKKKKKKRNEKGSSLRASL